jgi:hypothetical protein
MILKNSARLGFRVQVIDRMFFGEHALMQNAGNKNAITQLAVKHEVRAVLQSAQARTNIVAVPA